MKNILTIIALLISTIGFSQNFKTETTLKEDGSVIKTVIIVPDALGNCVGLKAVIDTDTAYYFFYKDQNYRHIVSYQTEGNFNTQDIKTILNYATQVKNNVVDNASYKSVRLTKSMGSLYFYGTVGYSWLNLNIIQTNFNKFLNQ